MLLFSVDDNRMICYLRSRRPSNSLLRPFSQVQYVLFMILCSFMRMIEKALQCASKKIPPKHANILK